MPEHQFFDPKQEYTIVERRLPHWCQAGTLCFITFRANDSMPLDVMKDWQEERDQLLRRHKIPPTLNWQNALARLPRLVQDQIRWRLTELFDSRLDECHGKCVLKDPLLAKIVADSLRHFDETRYTLTDFVIMPNHVHVIAAFQSEGVMLSQCASWKRFTARKINQHLGRQGEFWQQDGFDHLIRSLEQFEHYRTYIAQNPIQARLARDSFLHWSRPLV